MTDSGAALPGAALPGAVLPGGPTAGEPMPQQDIDAFYRLAAARRDMRNGFLPGPVSDELLTRVLTAAHQAPSVGLSQPWDFLIVRDRAMREKIRALARRQQDLFAGSL